MNCVRGVGVRTGKTNNKHNASVPTFWTNLTKEGEMQANRKDTLELDCTTKL